MTTPERVSSVTSTGLRPTALVGAARRHRVAVAASALAAAGVAWLSHVWIVATRYDGIGDPVLRGDVIPGVDNRLWGYVAVLAWSVPIGLAVGLVVTGGPRRAGQIIADRCRFVATSLRAAGARTQTAAVGAIVVGAVLWIVALRSAFGLIEPAFVGSIPAPQYLSTTYAAVLAVYLLLVAAGVFGGWTIGATGRVLARIGLDDPVGRYGVGAAVTAGLAAGLLLPYLLRSDLAVLLVCVAVIAVAVLRLRGVPTTPAIAVLLVVAGVAVGGVAWADDGGWVECQQTEGRFIGCSGTAAVYADALHSVPSAALGGGLGGVLAIAVVAGMTVPPPAPTSPARDRRPSHGSGGTQLLDGDEQPPDVAPAIRVVPHEDRSAAVAVREVDDDGATVAVRIVPRTDRGTQTVHEVEQ